MAQFNIVHLSDIHIKAKETTPSGDIPQDLKDLANDVGKRTSNMRNVVLVFTGDIVNIGEYVALDDSNLVLKFFKYLLKKFRPLDGKKSRLVDVQICPGNHDKNAEIGEDKSIQLKNYMPIEYNDSTPEPGTEEDWNIIRPAFDNFICLVNKIYEISNDICGLNKESITETFGVEFTKIYSDYCPESESTNKEKLALVLSFVRLNTAFITTKLEKENEIVHHLLVGKYQREKLIKMYQEGIAKIKRDDSEVIDEDFVTFTLSHYALPFLKHIDETKLKEAMFYKHLLKTEFFLYGHTHEREISSFSQNGQNVVCFETGIGWTNDNRTWHRDDKSYSIYTFNTDKNIYATAMLKPSAIPNEPFVPDNAIMGEGKTRIVSPWRLNGQPFIKPDTQDSDCIINEYFVDSEALENCEYYLEIMLNSKPCAETDSKRC